MTNLYLLLFVFIIDPGFTRAGKQNRRSVEELVYNSGSNRKEVGMGTQCNVWTFMVINCFGFLFLSACCNITS
jgi:hypothetical protein